MKERINVEVQYPELNHEECIANIKIETTDIEGRQGINIHHVRDYDYKNGMFINIINFGKVEIITFKAGDKYPNSMLGDICMEIPNGISAINVADICRFIRNDGSIYIDFPEKFKGAVYVTSRYGSKK